MVRRIGTVGHGVSVNTDRFARAMAEAARRAQEFADRVAARDADHEDDHADPADPADKETG